MADQIVITLLGLWWKLEDTRDLKSLGAMPCGCKSHFPHQMPSYTVVRSGSDCKSDVLGLGWCDPITRHHKIKNITLGWNAPELVNPM